MIKNILKRSLFAVKTVFKYAPFITCIYFILSFTSGVFIFLKIRTLALLIDNIVNYIKYSGNISDVIIYGILYIFCYLGTTLYTFYLSRISRNLRIDLTKTFTPTVLDKFSNIDYCYYEDEKFNNILKKMGQDPEKSIHNTFFSVVQSMNTMVKSVSILFTFFSVSWILGIVGIFIGIPISFIEIKITNRNEKILKESTNELRFDDYLQSVVSDKNYLLENSVFNNYSYINNKVLENRTLIYRKRKEISNKNFISSILIIFLKFIFVTVIIGILTYMIYNKEITIGIYTSIITAISSFLSILVSMAYSISTLASRTWAITYYQDFLNLKEFNKHKDIKESEIYLFEFNNVSFKYPNTEKEVLHHISFKILSNELVALVGPNGSGKSTIIKLLCGLYDPDEGCILINGIDIKEVNYKSLNRIISVVFQDFQSYFLTLRENISLGNSNIEESKIKEGLKQFELNELYDSVDCNLGNIETDARNISKGQWQKLALIRTYLSKSPFIILDEPTASLDPIMESKMYDGFIKASNNRGTLIISHRLASAKIAKKIIVINNGEIIGEGTHNQLLKSNELYTKMYNEQSSWYIDKEIE